MIEKLIGWFKKLINVLGLVYFEHKNLSAVGVGVVNYHTKVLGPPGETCENISSPTPKLAIRDFLLY